MQTSPTVGMPGKWSAQSVRVVVLTLMATLLCLVAMAAPGWWDTSSGPYGMWQFCGYSINVEKLSSEWKCKAIPKVQPWQDGWRAMFCLSFISYLVSSLTLITHLATYQLHSLTMLCCTVCMALGVFFEFIGIIVFGANIKTNYSYCFYFALLSGFMTLYILTLIIPMYLETRRLQGLPANTYTHKDEIRQAAMKRLQRGMYTQGVSETDPGYSNLPTITIEPSTTTTEWDAEQSLPHQSPRQKSPKSKRPRSSNQGADIIRTNQYDQYSAPNQHMQRHMGPNIQQEEDANEQRQYYNAGPQQQPGYMQPTGRGQVPYTGHASERGHIPDRGQVPDRGHIPDRGQVPDRGHIPDRGQVPDRGHTPDMSQVPQRVQYDARSQQLQQQNVPYTAKNSREYQSMGPELAAGRQQSVHDTGPPPAGLNPSSQAQRPRELQLRDPMTAPPAMPGDPHGSPLQRPSQNPSYRDQPTAYHDQPGVNLHSPTYRVQSGLEDPNGPPPYSTMERPAVRQPHDGNFSPQRQYYGHNPAVDPDDQRSATPPFQDATSI